MERKCDDDDEYLRERKRGEQGSNEEGNESTFPASFCSLLGFTFLSSSSSVEMHGRVWGGGSDGIFTKKEKCL